ncbi:MAG: lytic transglycosylase domain-containing protein [Bdellovibrionales bacterium]|nr:lytic transglycosylase domain-containing protein [Bdellovibrionales bacterium]
MSFPIRRCGCRLMLGAVLLGGCGIAGESALLPEMRAGAAGSAPRGLLVRHGTVPAGPRGANQPLNSWDVVRFEPIRVPDEPEVRAARRHWRERDPRFVTEALRRLAPRRPTLEAIFASYRLPPELLAVAIVESGFREEATSPLGARGVWQLMPTTARAYGLSVSWLNDERSDVLRATDAAARHLADLFDRFSCWDLALAAYNSGVGRVSRAIQAVGTRDFFALARAGAVPSETKAFVARVYAVIDLLRQPTFGALERPTMLSSRSR